MERKRGTINQRKFESSLEYNFPQIFSTYLDK